MKKMGPLAAALALVAASGAAFEAQGLVFSQMANSFLWPQGQSFQRPF